jgi:hypothetical protein
VEEFDAVELDSAGYLGQWMKPARELAERSAGPLAARPVWLFSGVPVGEPAKAAGNPVDVTKSSRPARPATTRSSPVSWPKSTSASPTGHGLSHPRPRRRLPQLGRDPRLGNRHRRRPAFLTSAREAGGISRLLPCSRRGRRAASHTHPWLQTARTGNSARLAAAILPSLKRAPIRRVAGCCAGGDLQVMTMSDSWGPRLNGQLRSAHGARRTRSLRKMTDR